MMLTLMFDSNLDKTVVASSSESYKVGPRWKSMSRLPDIKLVDQPQCHAAFLPHWLSILQASWLAYCHFSSLTLQDVGGWLYFYE